ncbi:MAG: imidazoleglycerol-phosphate dehydratase HisB [Chloroflexi bacterium]|jgi:imidazoleglycerol-phosphate dehydratase|nr:MAG: imidazoleglycerol-phosphate dehydratase HisB [Chloroflexota bacterium]RLT47774.1 MAG: imidazoleglycerol-phosphate dehydratase HisB [Chloroflexota bacterium]RLT54496.1 MAG: imidazoleglycerol-phosphate dehydratase HisB [Chloroflexota bacterium]
MRTATITRTTNETEITVTVNLDGSGRHEIATGIGFLDHMLAQVALHGIVDITLQARGDLHIDVHHTLEDCALALGQALDAALGARTGINRMGAAWVPMDEALAQVVLDLSGRPYAVVHAEWHTPTIGAVPTSLLAHFLESLAVTLRANLHARVAYGRDDHHQAEALFKALGRALLQAVQLEPRRQGVLPSSKGKL